MKTIIHRLKILPTFFVLLVFFSSFLECYADEFEDYLNRINTIAKKREQLPKSIYQKQWDMLIDNKKIYIN